MEKYGIFDANDVSLSNLGHIAKEESIGFEMRLCEMSFIADNISARTEELLSEGMSIAEILALLSEELVFPDSNVHDGALEEGERSIASFLGMLSASDRANFSSLLREKLADRNITVIESDFLPQSQPKESFIYVKNALADEAFDVFSQEFSDPRVAYADSFKEACFAVADKKYGYSIVPFEEKPSVRIPSISKLISDLDLKIVAITPVFGFEGNADMKYALIGRDFRIPECDELTDRYFEISIPKNSVKLSELLYASEILGSELYKVSTTIDNEDSDKAVYTLIFKNCTRTFSDLLIYLSLFVSEYIPAGIYKNIE